MRDIKEIEEEIKKLELELQETKEYNKENWKPKEGQMFYFINSYGNIDWLKYSNEDIYEYIINNNKVFKTIEEAEEYREYLKVKKEYLKVKKEYSTEFTTKEWEDRNIAKYYIYFDYSSEKLYPACIFCIKYMNVTYFTKENVEKFIKKYEKQILKYEFGIERK